MPLYGAAMNVPAPPSPPALVAAIVCHGPATARRLGIGPFAALDILELFAFTRPAVPCLPTVGGIADALGFARPETLEDAAGSRDSRTIAIIFQMVLSCSRN